MQFTRFASVSDRVGTRAEASWEAIAQALTSGHIVVRCGRTEAEEKVAKESQRLFSPAVFQGKRKKINVQHVSFGVLDFDHLEPERADQLLDKWHRAPEAWCAYSTWSHSAEESAFRLVVPFSRPVLPAEWDVVWSALQGYWGGAADTQARDSSRIYFEPSCPEHRDAYAWSDAHRGVPFDVDAALVSGASAVAVEARAAQQVAAANRVPVPASVVAVETAKLRSKDARLWEAWMQVASGAAWAPEGARDSTLWRMACWAAETWPDLDPVLFARHHFGSTAAMLERTEPSKHSDVLGWVSDKLERALSHVIEQKIAAEDAHSIVLAGRIKRAFGTERTLPYTREELEKMRLAVGGQLEHAWVVQQARSVYVLHLDGYRGPYDLNTDAFVAAHIDLAPAAHVLELQKVSPLGATDKTVRELVLEYGGLATSIVSDLHAQSPRYDPRTRTLTESPCPRRAITPRFYPEIDRWLTLLGGPDHELLKKWVAWVTYDRPCVALYLTGAKGTGKSLLAAGLAQIWGDAPTDLGQVFGAFNDGLQKCPLVFADEHIPPHPTGGSRTAQLRELIQSRVRPLKRKFVSDATLSGSIRILLAANNLNMLEQEALTADDVAAIHERLLQISAQPAAEAYLRSRTDIETWVTERKIAAHALALKTAYPVPSNAPRFMLDAEVSGGGELHERIATRAGLSGSVAHWTHQWLEDPRKLTTGKGPGSSALHCTVQNGEVLISPQTLVDFWDVYRTNTRPPSIRAATTALESISDGIQTYYVGGQQRYGFRVRLQALRVWARAHGAADPSTLIDDFAQRAQKVMH